MVFVRTGVTLWSGSQEAVLARVVPDEDEWRNTRIHRVTL